MVAATDFLGFNSDKLFIAAVLMINTMSSSWNFPWRHFSLLCIPFFLLAQLSDSSPQGQVRGRALPSLALRDLVPLTCNANIGKAICQSWAAKFGTKSVHSTRVVVPCGQCVIMDHVGNITFNDGLEINGRLIFPDGYSVHVYSTMIVVQGILDMKSTGAVTGMPYIQFTMIGDNEDTVFTPLNENAYVCGVSTCSAGKKGIIVAGGTVNRTSNMLTFYGEEPAHDSHHLQFF